MRPGGSTVIAAVSALGLLAGCGGGHRAAGPPASGSTAVVTATTSASVTVTTTAPGPAGTAVPQGFQPAAVSFVSPTEGFVIGYAPCAAAPCTASMARTRDAGRTWQGIPAPRVPVGGADGGVELAFADATDGVAAGGTYVEVTHDGGATWAAVAHDAQAKVEGLSAVGGTFYVTSLSGTATMSATSSTLTPLDASAASYQAGDTALLGDSDGHTYTVYRGRTRVAGLALPSSAQGTCTVSGSSATDLVADCTQPVASGSMGTRQLYGSTDAGRTWTNLVGPPFSGFDSNVIVANTQEHALVTTSDAATGGIETSTDGGEHWTRTLEVQGEGDGFRDTAFVTDSFAVALFAGDAVGATGTGLPSPALYVSRDGGVTWTKAVF